MYFGKMKAREGNSALTEHADVLSKAVANAGGTERSSLARRPGQCNPKEPARSTQMSEGARIESMIRVTKFRIQNENIMLNE